MKIPAGKALAALGWVLMMTACASIGPPQPPSLELPKPPADLRAVRKGDRVTLTWTIPAKTTDRQTMRRLGGTRICRGTGSSLTACGTPVGEAAPGLVPTKNPKQKPSQSYTDVVAGQMQSEDAASFATYAVEALNTQGRGAGLSNQVRVELVRTLPPPADFQARVTGQGVVLNWTNNLPAAGPSVHYVYRAYRRLLGSEERTMVGEVAPGGEPSATLIDSTIEWEKTYEYRAEVVTVIGSSGVQVEGDDTPEAKVFADDVFPPAVPSGLQAVFSGPGQQVFIDLIWAPVSDVDLDGYNIYRHEQDGAAVKVNVGLVKSPAYRDTNVVTGKRYFYSVSSVDVRGNESARSEEAGENVP